MPVFEDYRSQMKEELRSAMAKDRLLLTKNELWYYFLYYAERRSKMMYIPSEWIKNIENEKEVRALMEKYTGCFHFDYERDLEKTELRLKELGEYKILDELKKGTFGM